MAVPPDLQLKLRFNEEGRFTLGSKGHYAFVSNEDVKILLVLEKLVVSSVPPAFTALDITGWAGTWAAKTDVDDLDAAVKWNVSGAIQGAPANGQMLFTVPKASVNFEVQHGYSEFVLKPDGTTPQVRVPFTYTLTKQGITV